jgi:multidrug resistance efflux pump
MKRYRTFDDLKDSRLLYEKNFPAFGYVLLTVILLLLAGVVFWSTQTEKTYIVKATGTVTSDDKNYVMAPYSGEITSIDMEEGQNVQAGDVLFHVKSTDLDLQNEQLAGQRGIYEAQIRQYGKLAQSIQRDKNLFSASSSDDSLYYSQYEQYKSQVEQQKVDTSQLKSYGYTDAQIEQQIITAQEKMDELYNTAVLNAEQSKQEAQSQLDALNAQLGAVQTGQSDYTVTANASGRIHMLSDYKKGMVVQAASPIASIATEMDEYEVSAAVAAQDAPLVRVGDSVDIAVSGLTQSIYGTITGKVAQIDSDITMPQSADESGNAQPYFNMKIVPEADYLISKSGDKVDISNGMAVEARIQYDGVTYFDYVMEALGALTR